ncbi:MAG TPA: PPC domain-containing protein [Blastocatellia bacterium]|nr:PPC domain-containing protein [Blastocatellia bacterium]
MTTRRLILSLTMSIAAVSATVSWAQAGGPLAMLNGQPVRWARSEVRGGPLNSATVDSAGRVLYHVDSGTLGPVSGAQATAFVDRIFGLYTGIPTASIEFVNAGSIMDPLTNQPVDVNGSNVGRFISRASPTFQNPIIFDSDGSITGSGGVLGFFGFSQVDEPSGSLREGFVVLNGRSLTTGVLSTTSFLGVFTHEFGHFAGPLDHAQIDGNIASDGDGAVLPSGFSEAQAYDLYAPFTETLYPFLFLAPAGSQLGGQFPDSGAFVATLDLDTQNALSNLYPTVDYLANNGSVEGRVVIRTQTGDIPISGINVVARRVDQGAYPPPPGTSAFPAAPVLDADGVPQIPPPQAATDSLATISSAVTGLEFGAGTYRIQGLPPGQYLVGIQQINPDATGGSGIGPLGEQFPLPQPEEFFNGPNDSSNTPATFMAVAVAAGQVTTGIDIILMLNPLAPPTPVAEIEPNENKKKAPRIAFPVEVTGNAASTDASTLKMSFGSSGTDKIEDLYRFTVTETRTFYVFLDATSGVGDLDLYLFASSVSKKKTSLDDPNLLGLSLSETSAEVIGVQLAPGTYIVGVSAFAGSQSYRLRIITSA